MEPMNALYDRLTALVVVDVQNDFADPEGSLAVPGGETVVSAANLEIAAARSAGAAVFFTTDWHPTHTPHFMPDGGPWPVHCVAGSWGAELHPQLSGGGEIIRKGEGQENGYSGFTVELPDGSHRPTALPGRLLELGIEKVVVIGLATDYCVLATALDSVAEGCETTVLLRAIAAVDITPGDGAKAIRQMQTVGVTVI